MKFIHTADLHASRSRKDETLKVLSEIHATADAEGVDVIFVAGDFWDFTITATEASGFAPILRAVDELQKDFPVVMIYGTPTHEPDGSLECFSVMRNVTVIDRPSSMYIMNGVQLVAIPEPRMGKFEGAGMAERYAAIQRMYVDTFNEADSMRREGDKRILLFHGEVEGSEYQNGMTVPGGCSAMPLSLVRREGIDYGCLGHIHMPQAVPGTNCHYCGTPCPKDFGETHRGSFKLVEL